MFDGQLYFNASRGCGFGACGEYGLFRVGPGTAPLVATDALTDTRTGNYRNDYPSDLIGDPISRKLYFSASSQGDTSYRDVFVIGPSSSLPVVEAGRVVGILTETDMLRTIVKRDAEAACAEIIVSFP